MGRFRSLGKAIEIAERLRPLRHNLRFFAIEHEA